MDLSEVALPHQHASGVTLDTTRLVDVEFPTYLDAERSQACRLPRRPNAALRVSPRRARGAEGIESLRGTAMEWADIVEMTTQRTPRPAA
jgi:hypothetical protein